MLNHSTLLIFQSFSIYDSLGGGDANKNGNILTYRGRSWIVIFNLATGKRVVQYYGGIDNNRKTDGYEYTHQMP